MMKGIENSKLLKGVTYLFLTLFTISLFFFIKAKASDEVLKVDKIEVVEKSQGVEGNVISSTSESIQDNFTFHKLNDYVIYKIKIDNNLGKDVTIKSISDDNTNEYISYEYDKHEGELLESGKSINLLVKAVYKNDLTDITKRNQSANVKFKIDFTDEVLNVSINPKTNDSVSIQFIMLIISFAGLVICLILRSKSIKNSIKVTSILLVSITIMPLVAKAINLTINLNIESSYVILDKVQVAYNIDGVEKTSLIPYGTKLSEASLDIKEGYSITNIEDDSGNAVDPNTILKDDIAIEGSLVYSATPTYTVIDGDSFYVSAPNAKAYYVANSTTVPSVGEITTSKLLNKWTSSDKIEPIIRSNNTLYIYAMDENNNISINRTEIPVHRFEHETQQGVVLNVTINAMPFTMGFGMTYGGANYTIPGGDSAGYYVIEGAPYSFKTTLATGFDNISCTKNGNPISSAESGIISEDIEINCSAREKEYALSYDPNGGVFEGTSGLTVKTTKFGKSTLSNVGIPVREGYKFVGWFTDPNAGDIVYNNDGNRYVQSGTTTYWANITGGIPGYNEWVYDGDLTLYAHWVPVVTASVTNYNSFSYSSVSGVAYYVSTSQTAPSVGIVQDNFELNKWTRATNTGNLNLTSAGTFYIWAMDESGSITPEPAKVYSHLIKTTLDTDYTPEYRYLGSTGELIPMNSNNEAYVLSGTKLYVKFNLSEGHIVSRGTANYSNCDLAESNDPYSHIVVCSVNEPFLSDTYSTTVNSDILFTLDIGTAIIIVPIVGP